MLFRSGQTDTAGYALAGFDRPRASGGAVVVRGRSNALMSQTGGAVIELLRTGSALPAGLAGTFNRFRNPLINGNGAIVFHATINSAMGAEGIFWLESGIVTPVVVTLDEGTLGAFDVNDAGSVAYVRDDSIYLWDHTSTDSVRIVGREDGAPGGGVFRRIGPLALNASDVIAFAATRRSGSEALFTAGRSVPLGFVAERRFGEGAIAINAAGQVAFTSDGRSAAEQLMRFDPGSGVVALVVKGTTVGDGKIESFDPETVAIDDNGRVVCQAQLEGQRAVRKLLVVNGAAIQPANDVLGRTALGFATRLTADGQLVYTQDRRLIRFDVATLATTTDVSGTTTTPLGIGIACEEPSRSGATTVFAASREALESIVGGVATPVVQVGATVVLPDKTTTLTAIGSHAVVGSTIAFIGTVGGTDPVLLSAHDGLLEPVVAVGTKSPVGGAFVTLSDVLEKADGAGVLFIGSVSGGKASAGIFRADLATGQLRALATSARKGKTRLSNLGAPTAVGTDVGFRADQGKKTALFLAAGKRVRPMLVNGKRAPGVDGKINGLRDFVGTDEGMFAVVSLEEGDVDSVIYRVTGHGKPRSFLIDGTATPIGGAYKSVGSAVLAGNGPTLAFLVPLFGTSAPRGIFTAVGDAVTLRLLDGAEVPGGGHLSMVATDVLWVDGQTVWFPARLTGTATASRALIAVH